MKVALILSLFCVLCFSVTAQAGGHEGASERQPAERADRGQASDDSDSDSHSDSDSDSRSDSDSDDDTDSKGKSGKKIKSDSGKGKSQEMRDRRDERTGHAHVGRLRQRPINGLCQCLVSGHRPCD